MATTASGQSSSGPKPPQPPKSAKAPASPAPADVLKAKETLSQSLTDYPSARFQAVKAVPFSDGTLNVCGEVNAKNRMGGYTGWKHFVVAGDWVLMEGGGYDDLMAKWCTMNEPLPADYTKTISPTQ